MDSGRRLQDGGNRCGEVRDRWEDSGRNRRERGSITFSFDGTIPAKIDMSHTVKVFGTIIDGIGNSTTGSEQIELRTFIPKNL